MTPGSLGPRCKKCRVLKMAVAGSDDADMHRCPESPDQVHDWGEPKYDEAPPRAAIPLPPEDPLDRIIWDLTYVVQELPAIEPAPVCTRMMALAAAYQAKALMRIAEALEGIVPPPAAPANRLCDRKE